MKAIYHQDATTRVTLDILERNGNQVTLGREKQILIAGVPISSDATPGTCSLVEDPADAKAKAEADAKKAKDK